MISLLLVEDDADLERGTVSNDVSFTLQLPETLLKELK